MKSGSAVSTNYVVYLTKNVRTVRAADKANEPPLLRLVQWTKKWHVRVPKSEEAVSATVLKENSLHIHHTYICELSCVWIDLLLGGQLQRLSIWSVGRSVSYWKAFRPAMTWEKNYPRNANILIHHSPASMGFQNNQLRAKSENEGVPVKETTIDLGRRRRRRRRVWESYSQDWILKAF